MAPQPARERACRSQECPDVNPSGTLQPAALTTEGRADEPAHYAPSGKSNTGWGGGRAGDRAGGSAGSPRASRMALTTLGSITTRSPGGETHTPDTRAEPAPENAPWRGRRTGAVQSDQAPGDHPAVGRVTPAVRASTIEDIADGDRREAARHPRLVRAARPVGTFLIGGRISRSVVQKTAELIDRTRLHIIASDRRHDSEAASRARPIPP